MNKTELKKVYKHLRAVKKRADNIDDKLREFMHAISPGQYPTFFEEDVFTAAVDMLGVTHGEQFRSEVSYWFYDCEQGKKRDGHGKPMVGMAGGKNYVFDRLDTYLNFVIACND